MAEPGQWGAVYANVVPVDSPSTYVTPFYPSPNTYNGGYGNQFWLVRNSTLPPTGEQRATFNYSCAAAYNCTWRIALYAPLPQRLLDYSLVVQPLSITPIAQPSPTALSNATALNCFISGAQLLLYSFELPANVSVQLLLRWTDAQRRASVAVGRSSTVLHGGAGEFGAGAFSGGSSVMFNPSYQQFIGREANVGSPFPGLYYARVWLSSGATTPPLNFTIELGLRPYTTAGCTDSGATDCGHPSHPNRQPQTTCPTTPSSPRPPRARSSSRCGLSSPRSPSPSPTLFGGRLSSPSPLL